MPIKLPKSISIYSNRTVIWLYNIKCACAVTGPIATYIIGIMTEYM